MGEERITLMLRPLFDDSVEPDHGFADRLYATLAVEAGYRSTGRARRILQPIGSPVVRTARMAVLVALLALLALAAGLAASRLLLSPSAEDIVRASQDAFRDPPAFDMTARYPDGSVARFRHDGQGALRIESIEGRLFGEQSQGSWLIRSSAGGASYDGEARSWFAFDEPTPYSLFGMPYDWARPVPVAAGEPPVLYDCNDWERGPDATVAGRPAYRVTCGTIELLVDRESALLVGIVDPERSPAFAAEILELRVEQQPTELFALTKPEGAIDGANPPPSTKFTVGDSAPPLAGPRLGGGTFDTTELRGRPAAVYFWCSCVPGPGLRDVTEEARDRAGAVGLVIVAQSTVGTTAGATADLAIDAPVVLDPDWQILGQWGLSGSPSLVLLDPNGVVRAMHVGRFDRNELRAMLDALVGGEPVPSPAAIVPPPLEAPSTVLTVGQAPPDWTETDLAGTPFNVSDLQGRAAIVHFWASETGLSDPTGTYQALVEDLVAAWNPHRDAIGMVLVASGEAEAGALRSFVTARGWDVAVVVDWTGERWRSWGFLHGNEVVLLDAVGRVATFTAGCCPDRDELAALIDGLAQVRSLPGPRVLQRKEG